MEINSKQYPDTMAYFTTRVVQRLPDGRQLVSQSRQHRKRLSPVEVGSDGTALRVAPVANPWLQLWALHRIAWWIALLFIIGYACFALGSFASNWPHYFPVEPVGSGLALLHVIGACCCCRTRRAARKIFVTHLMQKELHDGQTITPGVSGRALSCHGTW